MADRPLAGACCELDEKVGHDGFSSVLQSSKADVSLPAGYTIPAAIIFILSFPPLFGQEVSPQALSCTSGTT